MTFNGAPKVLLELYREDMEALVQAVDARIEAFNVILSQGENSQVREDLERNLLLKTYLTIQLARNYPSASSCC